MKTQNRTLPISIRWMMISLTFVSAFLLFLIQPVFAKTLLPWFGGGAGVWAVCLVFFQTTLFLGYLYSHLLQKIKRLYQIILHLGIILIITCFFPVIFEKLNQPELGSNPYIAILLLLAINLGLPFFLLSTTSVLVQSWHANLSKQDSKLTYELYAYSNAGSLLALLSYPFLIEPYFDLSKQFSYWSIGFWIYAILYAGCAWWSYRKTKKKSSAEKIPPLENRWPLMAKYFTLAALGSAMLVAFTNYLCYDIAPFPFLWILPLVIYLLSFIFCFAKTKFYFRERAVAWMLLLICLAGNPLVTTANSMIFAITIVLATLFCSLMVVHGEVFLARPSTKHLTHFYLAICAGGAAGSAVIAFVCPFVFKDHYEYHILLAAMMMYGLWLLVFGTKTRVAWQKNPREAIELFILAVLCIAVGIGVNFFDDTRISCRQRNFYGVIHQRDVGEWRALFHGRIIHGACLNDPQKEMTPITYYGSGSGVNTVFKKVREMKQRPLRVGVLGLGAGSLAGYGEKGDHFVFYEINPAVVKAAYEQFPFLKKTEATFEIVEGDARLSLEKEAERNFDILVLDAFSSDAIPVHLITKEAFKIYLRHLASDGFIVTQISNTYLDLSLPMTGIAKYHRLNAAFYYHSPPKKSLAQFLSHYVILSRRDFDFDPRDHSKTYYQKISPYDSSILWTDQFSSLFSVIKPVMLPDFVLDVLLEIQKRLMWREMDAELGKTQKQWKAWDEKQKKNWESWQKRWDEQTAEIDKAIEEMKKEAERERQK